MSSSRVSEPIIFTHSSVEGVFRLVLSIAGQLLPCISTGGSDDVSASDSVFLEPGFVANLSTSRNLELGSSLHI